MLYYFYCVQVVLQGQNWNLHRPPVCTSVCTPPLEGRLQEARGCGHFCLSLAGPGWVQTPQVPPALAAGDTMMVNRCPSFSRAAPGFESPVCASQRNSLRYYFVPEFRNNITEYITVLCTLHWEGGISQSSSPKVQPSLRNLLSRGKRSGGRGHRLGIWIILSCNLMWEEEKNFLSWSHMGNVFWGLFPAPCHHSPYRVLLGGIPEHLIYPESVLWYLHKGIWRGVQEIRSPFLHVWYKVLGLPMLWRSARLWDLQNAVQNDVPHSSTASLLTGVSAGPSQGQLWGFSCR